MGRIIEVTGKTIEEAKLNALQELGLPEERVEFEILVEPAKGFLGFGAKDAKIKALELEPTPLEKGKVFLQNLLTTMGKDVEINIIEEEINFRFDLVGENLSILIGKHGQTLDALQYLTNMAANKHNNGSKVRIILDVEDYRKRREEALFTLAEKIAARARKYRSKVTLEPMNRYERKIIHLALQEHKDIVTYSNGVEPYRKVVVDIKHNKNEELLK